MALAGAPPRPPPGAPPSVALPPPTAQDEADAAAHAYTVRNVLSSAKDASASDLSTSAASVLSSPCFSRAGVWAAAVGGIAAAHRARRGGPGAGPVHYAVVGFLGTFVLQWYLCRREQHDQRLALRQFYAARAALLAMEARRGGSGSGAAGAGEEPDPGAEPAGTRGEDDDWRAEIDRVVAYERPKITRGPADGVRLR
jgi:hypothetical protein